MMPHPLHLLTITELAPRIANGSLSCLELTEACLEQVAQSNGPLNAFITVLADAAREQACRADEELRRQGARGPLHGIPISLKDLIDLADVPTTGASRLLAGHVAREDAAITARLRGAGAVFLGKCNLHEVAFGTTSEDSAYGPVRNPRDPSRSAGGSSGGSAAAVVTGMGCASIGTDTGGSIRIPSAACGCVGLKPTFGELPCDGIIPLSRSLDHVGPLARSVGDVHLLYRTLLGDWDGKTSVHAAGSGGARAQVSPFRLGVLRPYFMDVLDEEVGGAIERALATLGRAGVALQERQVPHAGDTATIYLHLQLPEASAYHAAAVESRPDAYTPSVRLRLELGRYVRAEDYVRAQQGGDLLRREVDAALESCDALVLPTLPIVAQPIGTDTMTIAGSSYPIRGLMLRLTQLFDVTGHPAISLPCPRGTGALPVGLQLVGRRHRTEELLGVAEEVERVLTLQGQP